MPNRDQRPYTHTTEIAGTSEDDSPSTEHHEKASGAEDTHNELRPDDRKQPDKYGPRTHDATRTTRKDGD